MIAYQKGSSHGEARITRESVSEGAEYVPFVLRSHELWREFEHRTGRTLLEQVGALFLAPAGKDVNSHRGHFVERALSFARECKIAHERLDEMELAAGFPSSKSSARSSGITNPVVVSLGLKRGEQGHAAGVEAKPGDMHPAVERDVKDLAVGADRA